ncbi:hypothetical protein BASA81_012913 [Batrachochytrium salamandrivorans]|nr:hypothetical protein BASA81_012906 [Batrachochytrium salamandrivorans]KAH9249382.1 hypothetical protein BASA81_012913 [Batrachochytrium salamandrivorans]
MSAVQLLAGGGRVPVWLDMLDAEVASPQRPAALVRMAARTSYLPLAAEQAREAFAEHAPDVGAGGVWFEADGRALRWSLPLGVLADLHARALPLRVTVRFQGLDRAAALPCAGEADVRLQFFHSLKQALSLRFGSARRLMEMPHAEQEEVWACVRGGRRGERDLAAGESGGPLPLRVVRLGPAGQPEVLQACAPPGASLAQAVRLASPDCGDQFRVHGVLVPGDAPASEVWEHMRFADLFLYVVV